MEAYVRLCAVSPRGTSAASTQGMSSAREELARIEEAVQELSEDQRRVLTLANVVGLSHKEIAEQLGKQEPAVRKLLSRARARLLLLLTLDDTD